MAYIVACGRSAGGRRHGALSGYHAIELGAQVDGADNEGMTPLMEAARSADGFDAASSLIAAKASLNGFSKAGFTPLLMAAGSLLASDWGRWPCALSLPLASR